MAFIVMLILAASMVNAAPQAAKISSSIAKPLNPQLIAPGIHVNLVKIDQAAPGNSEPISVSVNVTSQITQKNICGLGASSFKIDGPAHIANIYPISAVAINQPMTCDYWLSIVPNSPWVTGTHLLKIDYLQGGQKLADATLVFRI